MSVHGRPDTPDDAPICAISVDWWCVHEYVEPLLAQIGAWPMAGSVAWSRLDDSDPRKYAALLDAARHWALRVDTAQEARADAGREVSGAADWAAIARELRGIRECYIPRQKVPAA